MERIVKVTEETYFNRLDKFLRKSFEELKMASLYKMIRKGDVKLNGKRIKDPSASIVVGDEVSVWLPGEKTTKVFIQRKPSGKRELKAIPMDLDIIMEDSDLLVINKEAGISVHPGTGEETRATLIEGLMYYARQRRFEPYLVHRLDRNTSGVLLISKKRPLARSLSHLIAKKDVYKEYSVLFVGKADHDFICELPIEEKPALSRIHPLRTFVLEDEPVQWLTLASVVIETGRKHQIRRHLAQSGYPVAGDDKYGNRDINHRLRPLGLKRQFLHCSKMSFYDREKKKAYEFKADLKQDLSDFLKKLKEVD